MTANTNKESTTDCIAKDNSCSQILIRKMPEYGQPPNPETTFELIENIKLPVLKENELLIKAEYLSVDPYMRGRLSTWLSSESRIGRGYQVAQVIESTSAKFKAGDYVYGNFVWATKSVIADKMVISSIPPNISNVSTVDDSKNNNNNQKLFDTNLLSEIPHSYYIGSYGMPGMTAYYGMIQKSDIQRGENVFISGAAGAVGSLCGQIAKQKYACRVVGTAGSAEKIEWLTKELEFDGALNYKEFSNDFKLFQRALAAQFPNGIDIYFDNVGGFISEAVWDLLNVNARVLICGQISTYNMDRNNPTLIRPFMHKLIYREIVVRGLVVTRMKNHAQFYYDFGKWITDGSIKVKETIIEGFENTPQAFAGLFTGQNIGKMVIKC